VGVGIGGGLRTTDWSLRLRLHSGLRQRGEEGLRGVVMAQLKLGPSGVTGVGWSQRQWWVLDGTSGSAIKGPK
jgi:hypothetical protein